MGYYNIRNMNTLHMYTHTDVHTCMNVNTTLCIFTAAPPGKSGLGGICPGANLHVCNTNNIMMQHSVKNVQAYVATSY